MKSKRLLAAAVSVLLSLALAVPAAAAVSPQVKPLTADATIAAAKGYSLSKEESDATATSIEEALILSMGVSYDVVKCVSKCKNPTLSQLFANPAFIAEAKADLAKNALVQAELAKLGVGVNGLGAILRSETLAWTCPYSGETELDLSVEGLEAGQEVALLVYVPGELQPRVIKPTRLKNGKLKATLPVPCTYHIVK